MKKLKFILLILVGVSLSMCTQWKEGDYNSQYAHIDGTYSNSDYNEVKKLHVYIRMSNFKEKPTVIIELNEPGFSRLSFYKDNYYFITATDDMGEIHKFDGVVFTSSHLVVYGDKLTDLIHKNKRLEFTIEEEHKPTMKFNLAVGNYCYPTVTYDFTTSNSGLPKLNNI